MNTALLPIAITATVLDGIAYLVLIANGHVIETNPVIAQLAAPVALWAKASAIVLLVALSVLSSQIASRALRAAVSVALVVAIVVGAAGTVSTLAAA
jgi:hypothetical protein